LVNISSLAAIKPFETWSVYCMAKAARDMLQAVIAAETSTDSTARIKALSYAPGACDTDMQQLVRTTGSSESQMKVFRDMKDENKLVKPAVTAAALTKLLMEDKYQSGAHIDYWDT